MKKIIFPVILLIMIIAAIFYYTKTENTENKQNNTQANVNKNSGPIVIQDSAITDSDNTNDNTSNIEITTGEVYIDEVMKIRTPINDKFKDYLDKIKYKTIFTSEEATSAGDELESLIDEGISKFQNLPINDKFNEVNAKMIESLELLQKSKEALINYSNADTAENQQKYSDLYEYNLNKSDDLIKDIAIPK